MFAKKKINNERGWQMKIMSGHQPHYLPAIEYFAKIVASDFFVVSDDVDFVRHDWMNRNRVKGPNGEIMLVVPVDRTSPPKLYQTRCARENWADKHRKTLMHCYQKAPFFQYIEPVLDILAEDDWGGKEFLLLFTRLLGCFKKAMNIKQPCLSATYVVNDKIRNELIPPRMYQTASEKIAMQCEVLKCDAYITGKSVWDYMKREDFDSRGIKVVEYEFIPEPYPQHVQPHGQFIPNLSVVDLIANIGPDDAVTYMKRCFKIKE